MRAISVLGYKRPGYLDQCLTALAACRRIEEYSVVVSIDGPRNPSEVDLVRECARVAEKHGRAVVQLADNLGIDAHNKHAYDRILPSTSEGLLVAIEDDAVLSPDALELAEWYWTLPNRGEYALCSLGTVSREPAHPGVVLEHVGIDTAWAYCMTRGAWEKIRDDWNCKKNPPTGWDWSLSYQMWKKGWVGLRPALSRVRNIGREGGTHSYPEWFDANMSGTVESDGSWTGGYELQKVPRPTVPSWVLGE